MARRIEVQIVGDTKGLERSFSRVNHESGKLGNSLRALGRTATIAGAAVAGGVVVGLEKSVHAAVDAQASQARLEQAFKNAHLALKPYLGSLDNAESSSRKLGFADTEVRDALGSLITASGNYNSALKDLHVAQDLARFKGTGLVDATKMLTMAMTGSQRAAKQLGIVVIPTTRNVDALKKSHIDLTTAVGKADLAHAKLLDKMALGESVIDAVTKKTHGQASAFSHTAAGAMMKFRAEVEHVEVVLGTPLLGALSKAADGLSGVFGWIGRISHAPNLKVGLSVAGQGLKDFGDRIKSQVQGAISGTDWKSVGSQLATAIGSGITFSSNALNGVLDSMLGWVNSHAAQIATVGSSLAVQMVLTLTDPNFWAHHLNLLFGVLLLAFGDGIGRLAKGAGGMLVRALGPTFERAAGEVALFFMRGISRLPSVIGDGIAAMTPSVGRAIGTVWAEITRRSSDEAGRIATFLSRAFRLGAVVTVFRFAINEISNLWSGFTSWIQIESLKVVRGILEPFSHLPSALGGWARSAKNSINSQLNDIQAERVGRRVAAMGDRIASTAPQIRRAASAARTLADSLNSVPSDTTIRFIVKTLNYTPGSGPRGAFQGGGHAAGGRIRMGSGSADDVAAWLTKNEFVVTPGGERMLESMTFPGVLNWLEGRQPRAFAAGGRVDNTSKTVEFDRLYSAPVAPGGGAVSTHGLVPQVLHALSFARGHGWGGSVTSGFRTYAQQAALYARYLAGGPLAAKPGTSSHEFGQAVDVTDYTTFGATMAGAPAGSRLYNHLPTDPVHWSVSGYARGGRVKKPVHHAPHLPGGIREAEARASGTASVDDDIAAVGREEVWVKTQLKRHDLTTSERESLRVRQIRVENRLKKLRERKAKAAARARAKQIDYSMIPAGLRLALARARLTRDNQGDDLAALVAEDRYLRKQLQRKGLTTEQKVQITEALGGVEDEIDSIMSGQSTDAGPSADDQAQIDQLNARLGAANRSADLANAFVATGVFASQTPAGGGGQVYVFPSVFPPTAEQVRQAGGIVAEAAGGQGYPVASTQPLGV